MIDYEKSYMLCKKQEELKEQRKQSKVFTDIEGNWVKKLVGQILCDDYLSSNYVRILTRAIICAEDEIRKRIEFGEFTSRACSHEWVGGRYMVKHCRKCGETSDD